MDGAETFVTTQLWGRGCARWLQGTSRLGAVKVIEQACPASWRLQGYVEMVSI